MKRSLWTLVAAITLAAAPVAMISFGPVFNETYHPAKDGKLAKAKCAVCHVGMTKKLNPYGEDLHKIVGGSKKLSPDVLKKVEQLDSDKDGVKNIDEIKAGTFPGDPKSK